MRPKKEQGPDHSDTSRSWSQFYPKSTRKMVQCFNQKMRGPAVVFFGTDHSDYHPEDRGGGEVTGRSETGAVVLGTHSGGLTEMLGKRRWRKVRRFHL